MAQRALPDGVEIRAEVTPAFAEILTPEAVAFVARLEREFGGRRLELLERRRERQAAFDAGAKPDFLEETRAVRETEWTVAPVPADLQDRRVEITGPASDRKMVVNAFNSGASTYMADFEDANSPTWENVIQGQINVRDAVRRRIDFTSEEGKRYRLNEQVATLVVRPRGWHLPEKHIWVDGRPASGALVDFGLAFFHNARELLERGSGPYFYLPKIESHREARLWDDVFTLAEQELGLPHGVTKATVLIETLPAAFEMDEILWELRDHSAGLNCGRWDYIFSSIKTLQAHPEWILPDRAQVTMTVPFMRAYVQLAIRTCHRREAHCIGGMAAQIPVKDDPEANERAFALVRADKEREASEGHDGTWVAHPGLVPVAKEVFDRLMPGPHQIERKRDDVHVTAEELLRVPEGTITEAGVRNNLSVAVQYIAAWLGGRGAVPIFHLMEDAATAEIARTQLWQWLHHPRGILDDGRRVTGELLERLLDEEMAKIRAEAGEESFARGHYEEARQILRELTFQESLPDFFTLAMYERLP
ncbi:MAG: malate synthase A [Firmicutes bacterium]|nr:malate synthase A [Bacillota bacterium]